jgi:hypothetical protein
MGRHTETITIQDEGRDKGKVFVLTEMPATAAEKWATQALYLLAQSGVSISEKQHQAGMSGLAGALSKAAGGIGQLKALQDPSLDAWWDCVKYVHDPKHMPQAINQGEACQIEEIKTVTFLRMQVLRLHTAFFSPESPSTSESPSPETPTGSSPTRISRLRSGR